MAAKPATPVVNESKEVEIETWSILDWIACPDNPIQRDTYRHAMSASNRPGSHLSKLHATHSQVVAARLPSGKHIKLDGHTRALLWQREHEAEGTGLKWPDSGEVTVTVYPLKNRAEAIEFYATFDNSAATENRRDKLFGALKFFGLELHHGYLFQNCGVMAAIEYSIFPAKWVDLKNITFLEMVKPWVETIRIIDQSADFPNHTFFRSAIMLAMLMTYRRDGNVATSFWQGYHDDIGSKTSKSCDGIFCARDCLTIMAAEQGNKWGRRMFNAYTPYLLYCYDMWHEEKRMKRFTAIQGKRMPKDMLSVRQWWDEHLGPLDQQQIRMVPDPSKQLAML